MGTPEVLDETGVGVGPRRGRRATSRWATRTPWPSSTTWPSRARCIEPPAHDDAIYPEGVNVEFVVRRGERHVAMRVHERGSGETRSCGTGACAVMVATALPTTPLAGRRTAWTSPAARLTSCGPRTTGC